MDAERLSLALTLTIGGTEHAIPGACIERLELDLASHGFTGALDFVVLDDEEQGGGYADDLREAFVGPDLIQVSLRVAWAHLPAERSAAEPIEIAGLVRGKRLRELPYRDARDMPILARRYHIELADPAQVLWTQHFPTELYTEQSVQDVIEAHAGEHITLSFDWPALGESKPMFFVHLEEADRASFHDFVLWYVHTRGGVFSYDYAAGSYRIRASKDGAGTATTLFGDAVAAAEMVFPEVPRYRRYVLNSFAEEPGTSEIDQDQAVDGVRQDILVRTPLASQVDERVRLETARLVVPLHEVALDLAYGPADTLVPGALVELDAAQRWSSASALLGTTWRVLRLRLRAEALDPGPAADAPGDATGYRTEIQVRLEQKDDAFVRMPHYRAPRYPAFVEAKVVSELGEDADRTYQIHTDEDTSLESYTVKVPLWEDQEIQVPFEPYQGSGTVYIPAYKDARVLLAMDLEDARIARLLDWREGAPLSMDEQGEHLLFGKSAASNTSVRHVYEDDKPVFQVARTNSGDISFIRFEEGTFTLQVKEEEEG
jgi:hypothetical protein